MGESTLIDGSVVLFGVEGSCLIRDHPIHCVLPRGERIVTSVIRRAYVKSAGDESGDLMQRKYGRSGVFLAENVRTPAEVPPGTEVWVDRSAAAAIPPPQRSAL